MGVEDSSEDVVSDTGKVLHTSSSDHDHRVLLQIVTDSRDVRNDFVSIRKAHLCDLPECGIRLLRSRRVDLGADSPLLRAGKTALSPFDGVPDDLQGRGFTLSGLVRTRLSDELIDGSHNAS